ncbi:MAG: dephospho-CoA kinase [Alcanivoracaceae bacterium]|nr:dephospho-CoA kinase [Alcanivoracaceae bacterium]
MKIEHDCYTIGLTGGIASGKSAVSEMFATLGCDIIDADIIAREVVKADSDGLNQLIKVFGKLILNHEQQLDRSKLRKIVFNNSKKLALLNSIIHPLIQQEIINRVMQVNNSYCIIVIPLLCEGARYKWLDRVLLVDVDPEVQLQRLMKRDAISKDLALKMMHSQCSRKQRLSIADDVVKNERSLTDLKKHVETLNCLYKQFKSKKQ